MAMWFKGANAGLGKLYGLLTVLIAFMVLADGFVIGAMLLAIAGALLVRLESPTNSARAGAGVRVLYGVLVFLALMFIIG